MKTTLGRMAKLYGLHRSTLYEAVARGRVSAGIDGKGQRVIDLSEMIRVYGEPPTGQTVKPDTPTPVSTPPPDTPDTAALLVELRLLREEVAGLRAELRLIEHKPDKPPPMEHPAKGGAKPPAAKPQSFADLLAELEG